MSLFTRVLSIVGLAAGTAACASEPLDVGAPMPNVAGTDQDGEAHNLKKEYSTGYVLVFFYPRANTSGCTAQACSLRDAYEELAEDGVRVIGVSTDDVATQKKFQQDHDLPYTLLADTETTVADAFGVPTRMGFASRQAFLFKDGELVWRDLSASTRKQADDVKKALAELD